MCVRVGHLSLEQLTIHILSSAFNLNSSFVFSSFSFFFSSYTVSFFFSLFFS